MKEKFGEQLELNIYETDSEEAKGYTLLSSTNVFVNEQLVPRETALNEKKMEAYLNKIIS